jgi:hypothetical protein
MLSSEDGKVSCLYKDCLFIDYLCAHSFSELSQQASDFEAKPDTPMLDLICYVLLWQSQVIASNFASA